MKFNNLCSILKTHSPDAVYRGLPLLYWALKKPDCVALLLKEGANPDISCSIDDDLCVSPLYVVENGLRTSRRRYKRQLVHEILELYGASAIRYSDFCVLDVRPYSNEIIL